MVAERRVDEGLPQGLGLGDVGREYPDGVGWTDLYRLMNQEDPNEINPMFGVQDINIRTILKRTNRIRTMTELGLDELMNGCRTKFDLVDRAIGELGERVKGRETIVDNQISDLANNLTSVRTAVEKQFEKTTNDLLEPCLSQNLD